MNFLKNSLNSANKSKKKYLNYKSLEWMNTFSLSTDPVSIELILDKNFVLEYNKHYLDKIKTTLYEIPKKGIGVIAIQDIVPYETIAYYKLFAFKQSKYISQSTYKYAFQLYNYKGNPIDKWIGDIASETLQFPSPLKDVDKRNSVISNNKISKYFIPYWGYLVNEPSPGEEVNAYVDVNLAKNYPSKKNKKVYEGKEYVYSVVAEKLIKAGEEILIYYGDNYHHRTYEIEKDLSNDEDD